MPARIALLLLVIVPAVTLAATLFATNGEPGPTTSITATLTGDGEDPEGGTPGSVQVSPAPVVTTRHASAAELGRLAQALDRFSSAGLELPDLEILFSTRPSDCKDHLGLFSPEATPWRISICSAVDSVYEHELAHAWERATMTDELRHAFMELRGHTIWSSPDVPWNERGLEGVAFVIQQGVAGLPLPPVLGAEARSRLEAFKLLTGRPAPRLVEWIGRRRSPASTSDRVWTHLRGNDFGELPGGSAPQVSKAGPHK